MKERLVPQAEKNGENPPYITETAIKNHQKPPNNTQTLISYLDVGKFYLVTTGKKRVEAYIYPNRKASSQYQNCNYLYVCRKVLSCNRREETCWSLPTYTLTGKPPQNTKTITIYLNVGKVHLVTVGKEGVGAYMYPNRKASSHYSGGCGLR